jgi:hypothetical protein
LPVLWARAKPGTLIVGSCHDGWIAGLYVSGTGQVTFICSLRRCLVFNVSNVIFLAWKVEGDEQPEPHEQAEEEPLQPQPAMLMILFLVEVVWLGCGELVL